MLSFKLYKCSGALLMLKAGLSSLANADSKVLSMASVPSGITDRKRLNISTINQRLRHMEYAVRGEVVIAADRINKEIKEKKKEYPFDHIVYTNVGNPQSVGQQPLTWPRQVLALTDLPDEFGIDHPDCGNMFPKDAIDRARAIKKALGGHGTGAYTHSQGPIDFRKDIAEFIAERDGGIESNPERIFMTNGASNAINTLLSALVSDSNCGVMIPIPQYPIYSASIDLLGGKKVSYYLDESNGWDMNLDELERSLAEAKEKGIVVNSFVLINPGNPTGQVLSKKAVQDITKFCAKHNLVLLADEVYQENVYDEEAEFYSCKKAAYDSDLIQNDEIELVSFHSISKGILGECGRRGGYMELVGIDDGAYAEIYKLASASLCSGVPGQIMMDLMVKGPKPGDYSYESHEAEKKEIFDSLKRRAKIAADGFNSIPGFSCQKAQGAMYCFPKVTLPEGALKAAAASGVSPDTMYAVSLLEEAGICVIPASGFGQEEGRFGFRTTFLPAEDEMKRVVQAVREHHENFNLKYAA
eukprot:CAMPEP_0197824970 /NCGR_PEP_ID=MMETSP1437-20131217/2136_1 /TAXON_ID=49252 ORGANISM="Eucampia antarctica, Strain CCMP1452" /NCGR_SAMPLE_ID=MMETSP1437 /ASSEMBLY_ACC=CAM_ASM_001096 /LENGTH=527 /DNA_ID=CAMNT_0043424791 /DNA_START=191 /DNA_END=1774 /DNA_ORIENTATION=-